MQFSISVFCISAIFPIIFLLLINIIDFVSKYYVSFQAFKVPNKDTKKIARKKALFKPL